MLVRITYWLNNKNSFGYHKEGLLCVKSCDHVWHARNIGQPRWSRWSHWSQLLWPVKHQVVRSYFQEMGCHIYLFKFKGSSSVAGYIFGSRLLHQRSHKIHKSKKATQVYLLWQRNELCWRWKRDLRSNWQLEPETNPGWTATEGMPVDISTAEGFTCQWCLGEADTQCLHSSQVHSWRKLNRWRGVSNSPHWDGVGPEPQACLCCFWWSTWLQTLDP